jgi:hypothetical protein
MRLAIAFALLAAVWSGTGNAVDFLPPYPMSGDSINVIRAANTRTQLCMQMKDVHQIKTFTAAVHCAFDGYLDALAATNYEFQDLERERVADWIIVAEAADAKRVTELQAITMLMEYGSEISTEYEARRAYIRQQLDQAERDRQQNNADIAAIGQMAADAQRRADDEQLRASTQALTPPPSQQWPAWAPPPPSPPVNTECRTYAGVTRCTTQ